MKLNIYYGFLPDSDASKGGYIKIHADTFKTAFERFKAHYTPLSVLVSSCINTSIYPKGQLQELTFSK